MSQEIYILNSDKEKLLEIIDKAKFQESRSNANLKTLEAEINKARVIDQDGCSHAFIKMNSKIIMTVDQDEDEITLVYPEEADVKNNKISVLSPIGTAILGYRAGSCIEWRVPGGTVQIRIHDIIDQQETK
jgi:regulator of nucleoside diphosphate kinase